MGVGGVLRWRRQEGKGPWGKNKENKNCFILQNIKYEEKIKFLKEVKYIKLKY